MSDLYPICKHGNGMYRPSARCQTTVYFTKSLYISHAVSYLYHVHFLLFYQSKLKGTRKSKKKNQKFIKSKLPKRSKPAQILDSVWKRSPQLDFSIKTLVFWIELSIHLSVLDHNWTNVYQGNICLRWGFIEKSG